MKSLAEIADALLAYDPDALAAPSVNSFLAGMVPLPTQTQALPLMQALGRVLAQDIVSPIDVPPWTATHSMAVPWRQTCLCNCR